MEQEACQLLDKLTVNNQLNSQTLRYFYQDFMQMLFSFRKRNGRAICSGSRKPWNFTATA